MAATAMVAFHLVTTCALVTVMIELRAAEAEERRMTELMRALAVSICGRLPSRLPASL